MNNEAAESQRAFQVLKLLQDLRIALSTLEQQTCT